MSLNFWKDACAIFVGMFFGGLLTSAMGYLWPLGALAGGALGYFSRLLCEPGHIVWAFTYAAKKTIAWRPKPDWRERIADGCYFGIILGGGIGILMGIIYVGGGILENDNAPLSFVFGMYVFFIAICTSGFAFVAACISYCNGGPTDFGMSKETAFRYNAFMLHYHALKWCVIGMTYIPWLCRRSGSAGKVVLRFALIFVRVVHVHAFSACGMWAMIGGAAIGLAFPGQPILILAVSALGALAGAVMRRVVLAILPAPTVT